MFFIFLLRAPGGAVFLSQQSARNPARPEKSALPAFRLRGVLLCLLLVGLFWRAPSAAHSETLRPLLVPSEIARLDAEVELREGTYPGAVIVSRERRSDLDEKYRQPYRVAIGVYAAQVREGQTVGYQRRFRVHAPDSDALSLAKRVARMLLLLHGANRERTRFDHPRSEATVEVWLTRQVGAGLSPDVGGEQFRNQIYLYGIYQERAPEEWAREVAHEYGHYALPGVSGFTAPEEWGNGVLGERLFLKWLREDLRNGRLKPQDLPFVTPEQLGLFLAQQVEPWIAKVAREGLDARALARKDAPGMDYFIALALYFDSVYGSRFLLDAFAYSESERNDGFRTAPEYLRGALKALQSAPEFQVALPERTEAMAAFPVYLPQGSFVVQSEGVAQGWQIAADAKLLTRKSNVVTIYRAGWFRFSLTRAAPERHGARLIFRRKETE